MLGDFINRGLVMILGYAYPAFECFKTVERNKVEINDLRFWCQYWMIMAAISVVERFGDIFISWLPFYGETKVVFIVYLWYPKTKGTIYVYDGLLKPLVSKHETDIDRSIQELKSRARDFALQHWQNCAATGQATFLNAVQYVLTQSYKIKGSKEQQGSTEQQSQQPPTPAAEVGRQQPAADTPRTTGSGLTRRWPPAGSEHNRSSKKNNDSDEENSEYVHVDAVPGSPNKEKNKKGS